MAIPERFSKGFSLEVGVLRDKIKILRDAEFTSDQASDQARLLFELANAVYVLSKRVEEATED